MENLIEIEKLIKEKLSPYAKIKEKLNTTNNGVYIVIDGEKEYILKFYKSKNWPEKNKNLYVNSLLEKCNIPFARVIGYDRDNLIFGGGYILEEKLKGKTIDLKTLNLDEGTKYYTSLAKFIKRVHAIKFERFGWLNNGAPCYSSFANFLMDDIKSSGGNLVEKGVISKSTLDNICKKIEECFGRQNMQSSLCHGDLSLRNAIWQGDDLVLIDYDDAIALPCYADVSRLTFDMKEYKYYKEFRQAFFDSYFDSESEKEEYEEFEKVYHLYCAIDWMNFSVQKGYEYNYLLNYFHDLINELKLV